MDPALITRCCHADCDDDASPGTDQCVTCLTGAPNVIVELLELLEPLRKDHP